MPQRHPRFDETTEHLRDTGASLLLERGVRHLTLEALAEHGFASVGSIYERWSSRAALIDDLVWSRFEPAWSALTASTGSGLSHRLRELMEASHGQLVGTWLVELSHLARDLPELGHHAHRALDRVAEWCRVGGGTTSPDIIDRGAQWWLIANVIGHAQLRLGGARMPPMASVVARLAEASASSSEVGRSVTVPVDDLPREEFSEQRPLDDTAHRVVGVTRRLIAAAGGETSIRAVLAETGLAPGSLYRRFDSKRGLLLGVLEAELASASYDWVQGLVDATRHEDPIGALAAVFRTRFDTLYADLDTRNVILELTVQARTDEALRRTVVGQIEHVAAVRAAFFERFAAVGLLADDVAPGVCGWLVQAPAAGYRLMVGAGCRLDGDEVEAGLARVFWNLLSP